MPSTFNRDDLSKIPGMTPRLQRALEDQQQTVADTSIAVTDGIAATQGIADATVLVLSPNDSFNNERVLAIGDGFTFQDAGPGQTLTLRLKYPYKINGGFRLTWNLLADTILDLPTRGTVATTMPPGPYADDPTAASNGIAVGEMYAKTGGSVAWRQS